MSQPTNTPARSRIDYTASSKALQAQGDADPGDAIARHQAFLEARIDRIKQWVTSDLDPRSLVRFAVRDMAGDKGAKLRECTSLSVYLGLLSCAVTGLEPGSLKGEAFLVPYRNKGVMEATFMPGWKGLVKQARRSRAVNAIWSNVVYENDLYDFDLGTASYLVHKPARRDRGAIIGAYAIAKLSTGDFEIEPMDMEDLNAVRAAGANGPAWADWADQMYRKAPIRRLCKRLPMGSDYYVALSLESAADQGLGPRGQREIIDVETSGAATLAERAGHDAAGMLAQATTTQEQEATTPT